jgi:Icc-related predicted phosphoesterase
MKILFLADVEDPYYWDYYEKEKLAGIDLIISCGDLKPQYLTFFSSMTSIPIMYIKGNHDDIYETDPPGGCECIEDKVVTFKGLRICGLGGSMRYKPGVNQYTNMQMKARITKMKLKRMKLKDVDILVTHAPAQGLGDEKDLCHQGFEAFKEFMDKYHPKYMMHGHVHKTYGAGFKREQEYNGTKIVNTYKNYILEI